MVTPHNSRTDPRLLESTAGFFFTVGSAMNTHAMRLTVLFFLSVRFSGILCIHDVGQPSPYLVLELSITPNINPASVKQSLSTSDPHLSL